MKKFENILNSVISAAAQNANYCDDDYIVDGLRHCRKCKTKKQTRITYFDGSEREVVCLCKCEAEKRKQEAEFKAMKERIHDLRREGIQDDNISTWTFAYDDGQNAKMHIARKYVHNWIDMLDSNTGLLLYGNNGTGKSFMAGCIANALLDSCVPVLMTSFPRLINQLGQFNQDSNAFLKSLKKYKLIIIDDLGVERNSEFVVEQVYNIVDERYKSGLPMIITTNIPIEELKTPANVKLKRIYGRILENCVPVNVVGNNRREALHSMKIQKALEIFNLSDEPEF